MPGPQLEDSRNPRSAVIETIEPEYDASFDRTSEPSGKAHVSAKLICLILLASAAFVYCQVFVLPNVPAIADGDQGIYLSHATRMLQGQLIYRDYDHFTFPGTDVLYMALFRLFGIRALIPQAMLVLASVALTWLMFVISRRVLPGVLAVLPAALFLTLSFSGYLDASHHWYSTLAAISALSVLIDKRSKGRLALAGVLWGLAGCFTQSALVGALGVSLFLFWERTRTGEGWRAFLAKQSCFLGGVSGTVLAFLSYFVLKVGLKKVLYYTVVFVVKYYPADYFNSWRAYTADHPPVGDLTRWPDLAAFCAIHVLIPLVYILFFLRYGREARHQPKEPWDKLMLINFVGVFLFLSIISSPGYTRLYTVSPPAWILVVWLLKAPFKIERFLLRFSWATVLTLALVRPVIAQSRWKEFLQLPTGRTAFFRRAAYEKFKWASEHTHPGEYFVGDPQLCFALRLQNPARVPFLRPTDYTRPEEIDDVIQALRDHRVRYVGWYRSLDDEVTDPKENHLHPLRAYLQQRYEVATTFSNGDSIYQIRNNGN
jgi:hypothetical protein